MQIRIDHPADFTGAVFSLPVTEIHEPAFAELEKSNLISGISAAMAKPFAAEHQLAGDEIGDIRRAFAVRAELPKHLRHHCRSESLISVEMKVPVVFAGDVVDGPVPLGAKAGEGIHMHYEPPHALAISSVRSVLPLSST